jgi:hypothetical protein
MISSFIPSQISDHNSVILTLYIRVILIQMSRKEPSTIEQWFPYAVFFLFVMTVGYLYSSVAFKPSTEMTFLKFPGGQAFLDRLSTIGGN